MDISEIAGKAREYDVHLAARKAEIGTDDFPWYPYGTLHNFHWLDQLLHGENRDLGRLIGDAPIVDIGAADGDTAFFMESLGYEAHAVDNPPTNYNSCRGIRALRDAMGSRVEILERDLDRAFVLPRERYGFAFFLGILYHLKNPYLALESLSECARYAVVSTRITRFNVAEQGIAEPGAINDTRADLSRMPVAYLVDDLECNGDATNFWMFTDSGLKRLLKRAGWDVLDYLTIGNTETSDPATAEGDERAYALVRSRRSC